MQNQKKQIIVAGAGFGGISAALALAKNASRDFCQKIEITVVDRFHHQLFTPALYEISSLPRANATDQELRGIMLLPIPLILKNKPVAFVCDEIIGFDAENQTITLKNKGKIGFDYIIFALGSETNYFNIPGLADHSFPLKRFDDAIRLRNTIEGAVKTKDHVKIAVGGAGASGVEIAAEFINFVCRLKEKNGVKKCSNEFVLIEAAPDILPGLETKVVLRVRKRLEELGIRIKPNSIISSVDEKTIFFKNGESELYDVFIWTGGVQGPKILKDFGLPLSPKGSLRVNSYLQVEGYEKIFAVGDNSSLDNQKTGKPLTWTVPVAEIEGKIAAKNIILSIKELPLKRFTPWKKYPNVLAVGKKYAVADLVYLRWSGLWGWIVKNLVELRYLVSILPIKEAFFLWLRSLKIFSSND